MGNVIMARLFSDGGLRARGHGGGGGLSGAHPRDNIVASVDDKSTATREGNGMLRAAEIAKIQCQLETSIAVLEEHAKRQYHEAGGTLATQIGPCDEQGRPTSGELLAFETSPPYAEWVRTEKELQRLRATSAMLKIPVDKFRGGTHYPHIIYPLHTYRLALICPQQTLSLHYDIVGEQLK
jgi:hypothetical protein